MILILLVREPESFAFFQWSKLAKSSYKNVGAMSGCVIWTSLEPSLAVISACLPTLRPLAMRIILQRFSSNAHVGITQAYPRPTAGSQGAFNTSNLHSHSERGYRVKTTASSDRRTFDPERDTFLLNQISVRKDIHLVTESP